MSNTENIPANPVPESGGRDVAALVTVIIPVFNDPDGIGRCLAALSRQTWPADRFDVIVVDNGSTPPLTVSGSFPFRLRSERCTTPGSYAARNAGLRIAAGDVLAFTDADCEPAPGWLECGVAALRADGGRSLVGGEVAVAPPVRRTGVGLYQHYTGFRQRENIEQRFFSVTANLFARREHFAVAGPFDESLMSGGDLEWCWRAARHGIAVRYAADALVTTPPRESWRAAIRQVRRVVGGRRDLSVRPLAPVMGDAVRSRSPSSAARTLYRLLLRPELSFVERMKVLSAAVVLKLVQFSESLRLSLGGGAERR